MTQRIDIDNKGNKRYYNDAGHFHREDGPVIEFANGTKQWIINGKLHRENGPAFEKSKGDKEWFINGERHREDGPAIEFIDGYKTWYINVKPFSKNLFRSL